MLLGTKNVETLLQNLFEGEIDPTDEGPDEEEPNFESLPRRMTLDSVAWKQIKSIDMYAMVSKEGLYILQEKQLLC